MMIPSFPESIGDTNAGAFSFGGFMAREFAKKFYNSAAWVKTSKAYAASRLFICERCGQPAKKYVVHHKRYLTPQNINDPMVALSWDNLQLLCLDCHNATHHAKQKRKIFFDSSGQVIGVGEDPPSMSS